jgi:hypothetical protein
MEKRKGVSMRKLSRTLGPGAWLLSVLLWHPGASQLLHAASFTNTGSLTGPRAGHTANLLPNGQVLVLGGYDGHGPNRIASAELFDPASGTWTNTAPLAIGRTRPTATLLRTGKVLVAAGHDSDTTSTATCELYDTTSTSWTNTGKMAGIQPPC